MYDNKVLDVFLEKQLQLFPEEVAATRAEAAEFLDECMAQVCANVQEVREYLDEVADISGMTDAEILDAEEVFAIGDGRYLIVDA